MMRAIPLMFLAWPAAAQDVVFDAFATESCLATDAPAESCVGLAADACMRATEGGDTTVGMGTCLAGEVAYWDDRLNAAYDALRVRTRVIDAESADYGHAGPSQSEALQAMQRAWIPFRDAACAYERSKWGGGSGQGPAGAACLLRQTARQALALEQDLSERQTQ
ncbi:lysozyme inhibitor LprI family protein [uncultured Jannaschia sp.]|uniref:lysozyme inhibitor LprI family protein n=1 Tax=uncultured Jannaschia sp. TaxID=293347 RepID=UPI00260F0027|nr:lysozyme inhibitor LprI family protein [uncultured Jannaschia sp.]